MQNRFPVIRGATFPDSRRVPPPARNRPSTESRGLIVPPPRYRRVSRFASRSRRTDNDDSKRSTIKADLGRVVLRGCSPRASPHLGLRDIIPPVLQALDAPGVDVGQARRRRCDPAYACWADADLRPPVASAPGHRRGVWATRALRVHVPGATARAEEWLQSPLRGRLPQVQ